MKDYTSIFMPIAIICLMLVGIACNDTSRQKRVRFESSLGYTYSVDTLNGHVYIFDNHGMQNYPDCPKCKENLKETVTEVVDSIIDTKVVELLGK